MIRTTAIYPITIVKVPVAPLNMLVVLSMAERLCKCLHGIMTPVLTQTLTMEILKDGSIR